MWMQAWLPINNELRFWFGARLILTSIIYIIIANRGTTRPLPSFWSLPSLWALPSSLRPFKSTRVALLDMSFLLNVICLTIGTSYTIQNEKRFFKQKSLANVSVSIAFITTIGIILWHLLWKLRKKTRKSRLRMI